MPLVLLFLRARWRLPFQSCRQWGSSCNGKTGCIFAETIVITDDGASRFLFALCELYFPVGWDTVSLLLSKPLRLRPEQALRFLDAAKALNIKLREVLASLERDKAKGLTLSNSGPVLLGSRGFSLNRGRCGLGFPRRYLAPGRRKHR